MIGAAKAAGADMVKFQCYKYMHIWNHDEYRRLTKGILSKKDCMILLEHGKCVGVPVFFTPFYMEALYWLDEIDVPAFKFRHTDVNSAGMINGALVTKKPVYISYDPEKYRYIAYSPDYMKVLYCVGKYPVSMEDIDFEYIKRPFISGFSSHLPEKDAVEAAALAVSNGAEVLEFHVCMDGDDACIEREWSIQMKTLKEIREVVG